ncbi:MAG TPA: hypothetical protein PLD05_15370 [Thermogutta sp.]|nr:hypothetical protein [Thermogutta sp.]
MATQPMGANIVAISTCQASGTGLLAWVAKHFSNTVRIVLTGQPDLPTAMKAINEGQVFRFLTKPCPE